MVTVETKTIDDVDASAQIPSTIASQDITFEFFFLDATGPELFLVAEEHPLLAQIWDNDEDSIYDFI